MDEDLASVESAVRELAPRLGEVRDQVEAMRNDLSGLPFVGRG